MFIKIFSSIDSECLELKINRFMEYYKHIWEKDCKVISMQYSIGISKAIKHESRGYEYESESNVFSCAIIFDGKEKTSKGDEGSKLYYVIHKIPDGEEYNNTEIYAPSLKSAQYQWENNAEYSGFRDIKYIKRGHSWMVVEASEYKKKEKNKQK